MSYRGNTRGRSNHNFGYKRSRDESPSGEPSETSSFSSPNSSEPSEGGRNQSFNKPPNSNSNRGGFKRHRGNRNSGPPKPREPLFQKDEPKSTLLVASVKSVFPVFVSNLGCTNLGDIVYQVMTFKNNKLTQNISREVFLYVIHLSFVCRLVRTTIKYGYGFPLGAERLFQICAAIELPDIICRFLESIGRVEMANGTFVVPASAEDYMHLIELPTAARSMTAYGDYIPAVADPSWRADPWCISTDTVLSYVEGIARGKPSGIQFRTLTGNEECAGSKEMLVSYRISSGSLSPFCPEKLSETEAQKGALYQFRDAGHRAQWGYQHNKEMLGSYFTTTSFEYAVHFAKMCTDSFAGPK